jgi:aquaporin Z
MPVNKYLTELIGTFFLVLTIGCSVIGGGTHVVPPLAIGGVLMVMIFAGAHVSGAHYNPAVTLAVWMRGRCATTDVAPYWVAQVVGGLLAAFAVKFLVGTGESPLVTRPGPGLLGEFLFTFALAYVVLNVATAKGTSGNMFYGLAIGGTVMAGAFSLSTVSGGAFNPAVAIGASTMGLLAPSTIWIHIIGELAGAAVAAVAFKFINPEDK